ncbi:MAG TPA: alpha/beta family hydrolase [Gemmatimonadota bacterium]|nr:alpha/beta family hydrolase [Gemmatimonadota bacterium]
MAVELRFTATRRTGEVSGLLRPTHASSLFVLAHGAGAGMRHPFLESVADLLASSGIATFRFQFPYAEQGRRRPDPPPVLVATVRSAVALASEHAKGLRLLAGGKSMGGRMTSLAAVDGGLPGVAGLVFLGFPLHAAGRPSPERGDHLASVRLPMLFLQGTRDRLADLGLLRPLCRRLGDRVTLRVFEDADHSFHVRKASGRTDGDILDELVDAVAGWVERLPESRADG